MTQATSLSIDVLGPVSGTSVAVSPTATQTYVLTASNALGNATASASVTVYPALTLSVSPSSVSKFAGQTVQFTANVNGAASSRVSWSIDETPDGGAVTGTGLYTAPWVTGTFHVRATSLDNPLKSDAAIVSCTRPAPGTLDTTFGNGIEADVSNPSPDAGLNLIKIEVLANDNIVLSGGTYKSQAPFVMELGSDGSNLFNWPAPRFFGPSTMLYGGVATDSQFYLYASMLAFPPLFERMRLDNGVDAGWTPTDAGAAISICVARTGFATAAVAGSHLARYIPDGGLDPAFGSGGLTAQLGDGGSSVSFCQYTPDGSHIFGEGLGIQGSIIVKLNGDGSSEPAFNGGAIIGGPAQWRAFAPDHSDRLLGVAVINGSTTVARLSTAGTFDPTFGSAGLLPIPIPDGGASDVTSASDDSVLSVWTDGNQWVLIRTHQDGSLDTTFGTNGVVIGIPRSAHLGIQHDGKIIVGGEVASGGRDIISVQRYWP